MKKLGRRKFLQGMATVPAALAAGMATGCTATKKDGPGNKSLAGEEKWGRKAGEWIPSCCNMCGGQCGIMAHVVDGQLTKIEPNNWNPNNYCNVSTTAKGDGFFDGYTVEAGAKEGGALCPKGNAGIMQLYDPNRVKRPMKRTNPEKGVDVDPKWVEISYEQALSEISAKLKALQDAKEQHKLLWWSEDHSFTHIQGDFCEFFGTPNYSNHANLCDVSRKAGFKMVMGDERPLADPIQSKYIMLWGWNPLSALKWVHLGRCFTRGIENGARMVVIDPYMSDTAIKGQEWVPIRPGTDGALALAMCHVIVRDGLYDKEFVEKWSTGFQEFSEYIKDKTPEWAEAITTVPAANITRLAIEVATTKPAVVDVWSGPGQQTNGVQGGRAIACLTALVGGYDRPGTMMIPNKSGNSHVHIHAHPDTEATMKQPRFDGIKDLPWGHKSGVYGRGFERLADGTGPYEPKVGFCVFQNLVMSGPGTTKVVAALKKLETFVVVDTMFSETAQLADYLIPGTVYLERYDWNTHWVTWPTLGLRQPVVKAKEIQASPYPFQGGIFGQMAEYEFVVALGRTLGLKDAHGAAYYENGPLSNQPQPNLTQWYEEFLSAESKAGAPKMGLEEIKKLPGAVWTDPKGTEYEKYAKALKSKLVVEGGKVFDKPAADPKRKQVASISGDKLVRVMGKVEGGKILDDHGKTVGHADGGKVYDKPADAADRKEIAVLAGGSPVETVGMVVDGQAFFTKGITLLDKPTRDKGKQIGSLVDGKPLRGFMTPSGKCEFYNADFAKKKDLRGNPVNPLPAYSSREWMPDAGFPLYLINWKEANHTHSRSQNNAWLMDLKPENPLVMARSTAAKLGIKDGDKVWVESKYGKAEAVAKVTDRMHPEVVGAQHGFGHWAMGKIAKGRGTSFADLNYVAYDPMSGQAVHKEICVKVYKATV